MAAKIEKSFPFASKQVLNTETGLMEADRTYSDFDFANYFNKFISDGVYPNPSNQLKVVSVDSNLNLTVKVGAGFIKGRGYQLSEDKTVKINNPSDSMDRRDIIVLQCDFNVDREIKILYKAGVPSSNPIKPTITRNADVWELELAEVLVRRSTKEILQADITDSRLNSSLCGIVVGLVQQIDTTNIFTSYQSALTLAQNNINSFENKYNSWFNTIQADILDKKYFDFDNMLYRKGFTYKYTKTTTKITEQIINTINNSVYATRTTDILADKFIIKTICTSQNINTTETYNKIAGNWEGKIE
jgi:hypothetical protein